MEEEDNPVLSEVKLEIDIAEEPELMRLQGRYAQGRQNQPVSHVRFEPVASSTTDRTCSEFEIKKDKESIAMMEPHGLVLSKVKTETDSDTTVPHDQVLSKVKTEPDIDSDMIKQHDPVLSTRKTDPGSGMTEPHGSVLSGVKTEPVSDGEEEPPVFFGMTESNETLQTETGRSISGRNMGTHHLASEGMSSVATARCGRGGSRGGSRGDVSRACRTSTRGRSLSTQLHDDRQAMCEATQAKQARLREVVNQAPPEQLRDLALKFIETQPSLVHDLVSPQAGNGYHPPACEAWPPWCVCHHCREMPTQVERVCCLKQDICLSTLPEMDLIMDPFVLRLSREMRRDLLVFNDDDLDSENKSNRHAAYRQFILWRHGILRSGSRLVVPSCCVWRIRDRFPDPYGQYKEFRPSPFS